MSSMYFRYYLSLEMNMTLILSKFEYHLRY